MATTAKPEKVEYKPLNDAFFAMMWNFCRWATASEAKVADHTMRNFDNLLGAFEVLEYLSKTGFLAPYISDSLGRDLYQIRLRLAEAYARDQENDDAREINEIRVRIIRRIEDLGLLAKTRGYR